MGMSKKVNKAFHTFLFMEVPDLKEVSDEFRDDQGRGGFVAMCNETGEMIAVDENDGWKDWPNAPQDPIERVPFALNAFCHHSTLLPGAATHILGE
jgi:hypothetical protein